MKRWLTIRNVLIFGAVLFALGVAIASWESRRFRETEYATFTDQSLQLASVFARSARVWLSRGNDEALGFAANLLLAGSGQFVRIDVNNTTVLDKRNGDPNIEALDLRAERAASVDIEPRATLTPGRLDVVIAIDIPNQRAETLGVVQIGFSDAHARGQVSGHRLLVFGLTGGSWLVLMMLAILAVRILKMRLRLASIQSAESLSEGMIRCGVLEIDTDTCAVRLRQQDVELTPKMFQLLTFLARNQGKTFSDADLVAALWPEAPYAASGDVKQCIYMLRRRLSVAGADPKRIIVNVKGFGYKLEAPTEVELSHD